MGLGIVQAVFLLVCVPCLLTSAEDEITPRMSDERVVFHTKYGSIEWGFWPEVAPVTSAHIFKLVTMGLYTSNHIFRVDKGFVAQTAGVIGGVQFTLTEEQQIEAAKTVPLEVKQGVKHHAGVLSMGRFDDPNSGTSSYSMLLGDASHLDMHYTIFGKITSGMETLHKLEELPTKREGIFVMPLERITIISSHWYRLSVPTPSLTLPGDSANCDQDLAVLKARFESQADELQRVRRKCLPA